MEIRKATRQAAKLRIGLSAVTFGGKTYSSLLLAYGMTKDWSKICIIDSENGSADLYENLGDYGVIQLNDYSPNSYIKAIKACEKAGIEVCIIDSISHEWDWCLAYQLQLGGRYQDWGPVKALHKAFKDTILSSSCHIITTNRRKSGYTANPGSDGKLKIEKVGLKEITEDGFEYELTIALELERDHTFSIMKDRTGVLKEFEKTVIVSELGEKLMEWSKGSDSSTEKLLQSALIDVSNCTTASALSIVYNRYTDLQKNEEFLGKLKEVKQKM